MGYVQYLILILKNSRRTVFWDGGLDRQKDIGSPVDMLVNTVAQMQKDIATLREENRLLRTPAIPQVVQAPPAGGVHDNESATVRH